MPHKKQIYKNYIKRILDFSLSLIALIVLSPAFIIITILVGTKLGKPVIFKQARPGKNETIFYLYKFRTMTNQKDEKGEFLPDEVRLTAFGKLLRKTSLDELPELWNILKGDMSIVGPRPLLIEYLPYYSEREKTRHSIRGGLTGLAQVSGRNYLPWDERLEKDAQYVENLSFGLDVHIVMCTIKSVFRHEDIAVDTDKIEGNFADIRKEVMKSRVGELS